jgi:hypothetical protein
MPSRVDPVKEGVEIAVGFVIKTQSVDVVFGLGLP